MLLFTSYLFITAIAGMFFTSWFASAVGVKRTLMIGLVLVVLFAALAAGAGSVNEIIGLRAGWGTRQRPVHLDRARRDRRRHRGPERRRDHPLRDRARDRHGARALLS